VDPGRTPYDLNFGLFGFRVRVHPFFWLGAALLGGSWLRVDPILLLIWIGVVFISIVVHEFGHAITYRLFGCNSFIVLYAFGGLAVPYTSVPSRRWKRILVLLAGPFAGFALAGLLYGFKHFFPDILLRNLYLAAFIEMLIYVNFVWGLFNLLPVFPLDGGQISRELCEGRWHGRGTRISLQISLWAAVAVVIFSLVCQLELSSGRHVMLQYLPAWVPLPGFFTAILFAILAYQSYQLLQQTGRGYYEGPDDRSPWGR
jgi:Zn-dependent protease